MTAQSPSPDRGSLVDAEPGAGVKSGSPSRRVPDGSGLWALLPAWAMRPVAALVRIAASRPTRNAWVNVAWLVGVYLVLSLAIVSVFLLEPIILVGRSVRGREDHLEASGPVTAAVAASFPGFSTVPVGLHVPFGERFKIHIRGKGNSGMVATDAAVHWYKTTGSMSFRYADLADIRLFPGRKGSLGRSPRVELLGAGIPRSSFIDIKRARLAVVQQQVAALKEMIDSRDLAFRREYQPGGSPVIHCPACGHARSLAEAAARRVTVATEQIGLSPLEWDRLQYAGPISVELVEMLFQVPYSEAAARLRAAQHALLLGTRRGKYLPLTELCAECQFPARTLVAAGRVRARDAIPARLRFRVLHRDGFRCQYCGRSRADGATLHIDHLVPVVSGGAATEENLVTACEDCNLGKAAASVVD